jgi:NADPH2:quinone reductase
MKAIRVHQFGGPEVMRIEEVPDPNPGPGEVVVRIQAAGVNPVETYIRSGAYARKPALPYTPGIDAGGTVAAIGPGITKLRPGDRVYTWGSLSGSYAELALCTEAQVHPLPQKTSFAQGAAVGVPYSAAYRAMFQAARALPGETMLVHGASGGVGIAAVQLGRAAGLTVISTAGSEKGRALVAEQGAHLVLDHTQPDYLEGLMKFTAGRGADLILEMLANKNLAKDLSVVAQKGRIIVIGNRGTIEINPRDAMGREASIHGIMVFGASESEVRSMHAALVAGLENGSLRPVIGQEIPLAEAPRAHQLVMESKAYGKIVLVP